VSLPGGQDAEERSKLQIYDPLLPQITKHGIRVFGVAFQEGAFVLLNRVSESTKGLYRRALEPRDFTPILRGFAPELCPKPKKSTVVVQRKPASDKALGAGASPPLPPGQRLSRPARDQGSAAPAAQEAPAPRSAAASPSARRCCSSDAPF
jgi:hypothetical protein